MIFKLFSRKQKAKAARREAIRSVDLTAEENQRFVHEFLRARTDGLLTWMDISQYVQRRRQDSGLGSIVGRG